MEMAEQMAKHSFFFYFLFLEGSEESLKVNHLIFRMGSAIA